MCDLVVFVVVADVICSDKVEVFGVSEVEGDVVCFLATLQKLLSYTRSDCHYQGSESGHTSWNVEVCVILVRSLSLALDSKSCNRACWDIP